MSWENKRDSRSLTASLLFISLDADAPKEPVNSDAHRYPAATPVRHNATVSIDFLSIDNLYISPNGPKDRSASRHPRHAHPEDPKPRRTARLWNRAVHQARLRRCAHRRGGLALSRPPASAPSGMGQGRVEDDRQQPPRPFLHAHR